MENPDFHAELAKAGGAKELVKFWRSPVFSEKFSDVPAFLLPRFTGWSGSRVIAPGGEIVAFHQCPIRTSVPAGSRPTGSIKVSYSRLSSSTGMVRTPAVWRSYSAKPG